MKFNFNLNSIWKFVVGGGTVLGYQAFYERMVNKKPENEMNDAIKSIKEKIFLSKKIANSNEDNRKI